DQPRRSTAASSTYAAPPSASGTSPTTSPEACSRPGASDPDYTLDCDEPVNGPASPSGRVRNAATWSSRSVAIRETWDLDRDVMPKDCTSLSIRRVETPSR